MKPIGRFFSVLFEVVVVTGFVLLTVLIVDAAAQFNAIPTHTAGTDFVLCVGLAAVLMVGLLLYALRRLHTLRQWQLRRIRAGAADRYRMLYGAGFALVAAAAILLFVGTLLGEGSPSGTDEGCTWAAIGSLLAGFILLALAIRPFRPQRFRAMK